HFDVFNAVIDNQREDIRSWFDENFIGLLKLSACLDPTNGYKAFDIDAISKLANEYYTLHFPEQEKEMLKFQLMHFQLDVVNHHSLKKLSSIFELCQGLV
ncbi:hypothetical protein LINPERPRIM_LOCUS40693, partial [Linum perenne]